MGCGASSRTGAYAPKEAAPAEKASREASGPPTGTSNGKLRGEEWVVESQRLIETLRKLEEILKRLFVIECGQLQGLLESGRDGFTSGTSTAGDRALGLRVLARDAAIERERLEQRLKDDPGGRDPIDLPELAAAILRALAPLFAAANAREQGVRPTSGSPLPLQTGGNPSGEKGSVKGSTNTGRVHFIFCSPADSLTVYRWVVSGPGTDTSASTHGAYMASVCCNSAVYSRRPQLKPKRQLPGPAMHVTICRTAL
ncbi:unnamed protein product [Polarella glacialis]|uniref:Uncharacterized protein n=1 Tax=Polarella glacialis TaxID=89957 RepID=A0A813K4E7_POLGL|nr:unnamed protein product [Polarella glacialis]